MFCCRRGADCSELFEVAYKWILPIPKRDLRALCALQSVPGSTKQRKKNKKKGQTSTESGYTSMIAPQWPETEMQTRTTQDPAFASQSSSTEARTVLGPPAQAPIAPILTQDTVTSAPNWSSRNPGFAQYHQYVWQIQKQNPNIAGTEAAFDAVMEKLQANSPIQTPPPPRPLAQIILPPPQFNLGQPPPTLLSARKEIPLAPKPSPPSHPDPPPPQPSSPPRRSSGAFKFCSIKKKWVSLPPTPSPTYHPNPPHWRDQIFYRSPISLNQAQVRIAPAPPRPIVPSAPILGPFRPLPPESGYNP